MTAEQWRTAWEIYRTARELQGSARPAYLESATTDVEIAREVLSLLQADIDEPGGEAPVPSRRTGEKVGHYELIELLARGGMGEVYSARDCKLNRLVALKFVLPEAIGDRAAIRRSIYEARAASALNHPNIVTIYDVIHEESGTVIAMELVEGRSLREFCGAALNPTEIVWFGRQIALALAAAHQKGIIHRDIKPENLKARDDGFVKVLDFGLARDVTTGSTGHSQNTSAPAIGTPRYMSPEQLKGQLPGGASDVFSLGIVLYELATGSHPFDSVYPWETAYAITSRDPIFPSVLNPTVTTPLGTLILAMLAKDPDRRPSAALVAQMLEDGITLQQDQPGAGKSLSVWRRGIVEGTFSLTWRWVLVSVLIATGIGMMVVSAGHGPSTERSLSITALTTAVSENRVTAAVIAPTGNAFVYAALDGIHLRTVEKKRGMDAGAIGEAKTLEAPPGFRADRLAWLPDGSGVLASGSPGATGKRGIWIIFFGNVPPRLVREGAVDGVPSPDGRYVAFTTPGGSEVWVADISGDGARRIVSGRQEEFYSAVLWSFDSRRVGYQRLRGVSSVYDWVDVVSGKLAGSFSGPPMDSACLLADGRMFFLRWDGPDQMQFNVWMVNVDPRAGYVRGEPRQITRLNGARFSTITATAAGERITFLQRLSQPEVYVGELEYPGPRLGRVLRLTYDIKGDYPHSWTADSKSILFESDRAGTWDLYQQQIDQRVPKALAKTLANEVLAQTSSDGRWILFLSMMYKHSEIRSVRRVPSGGGTPELVSTGPLDVSDNFRCSQPGGRRCIFKTTEGEQFIFWDLDPLRGKGRVLARVPRISGELEAYTGLEQWGVSSSGSQIAITTRDAKQAYILLIDLEHPDSTPRRVVPVVGHARLNALAFAADDKGWFVSVPSSSGVELLYVNREGQSHVLHEAPIHIWGVPSPDGRRIAFVDHESESNVIMIEP